MVAPVAAEAADSGASPHAMNQTTRTATGYQNGPSRRGKFVPGRRGRWRCRRPALPVDRAQLCQLVGRAWRRSAGLSRAWPGSAGAGLSGGLAGPGRARRGSAGLARLSGRRAQRRLGRAWRSLAGLGWAQRDSAGLGRVWQGLAGFGGSQLGSAEIGRVWRGSAGLSGARPDSTRLGDPPSPVGPAHGGAAQQRSLTGVGLPRGGQFGARRFTPANASEHQPNPGGRRANRGPRGH
jgi:hypothetical protein